MSLTSSNGLTRVLKLYDYSATKTWRGLPARWFSSARRRVKRLIKQNAGLVDLGFACALGDRRLLAPGPIR